MPDTGLFDTELDVDCRARTARPGNSSIDIALGRAEDHYARWPTPTCILSDGPYGVSGFPGDSKSAGSLPEWYAPHIDEWSRRATPETSLWFWCTEVGWATVHPVLAAAGWEYRSCNVWDKGLGHVAGNANTKTLRLFPVVTEVCVFYVRRAEFHVAGRTLSMQDWLRHEWSRSGLTWREANLACGVANAATRKYLTADHLWYYPPPEAFTALVEHANRKGLAEGRPYFSIDGKRPLTTPQWARLRSKFRCDVGITNVWRQPQVAGAERVQGERRGMRYKFSSLHGSQKPLNLTELTINATTEIGDAVWEPFGGLCPGAVVCKRLGRRYFAAEPVAEFHQAACRRAASA